MMRLKVPRRVRPVMPALEAEPVEAAQKLPEEGVLLRRRRPVVELRRVVLDHQLLDAT